MSRSTPEAAIDPVKDFAPIHAGDPVYPQVIVLGPEIQGCVVQGDRRAIEGLRRQGQFRIVRHRLADASRRRIVQARHRHEDAAHPYRGQAPALNDMLGGQLDIMFPSISDVLSFLQAGKLRAVAAMSDKRLKRFPDVPTTAELGYPGLVSSIWQRARTMPARRSR